MASKPIILAFRPDLTDIPTGFTHAVVPIYINSDFSTIRNLLSNELHGYIKIAAIDSGNQIDRIFLVNKSQELGFDMIEMDEQLSRNTLTPAQLAELKTKTNLPIAITSVPDPLIVFVIEKGGRPDAIFMEAYNTSFASSIGYIKNLLSSNNINIPVYGAVNFADSLDSGIDSDEPDKLNSTSRYLWNNSDGIWFWGWKTGNPTFEQTANNNWPIVKQLVTEFICYQNNKSPVLNQSISPVSGVVGPVTPTFICGYYNATGAPIETAKVFITVDSVSYSTTYDPSHKDYRLSTLTLAAGYHTWNCSAYKDLYRCKAGFAQNYYVQSSSGGGSPLSRIAKMEETPTLNTDNTSWKLTVTLIAVIGLGIGYFILKEAVSISVTKKRKKR